MKKFSTMFRKGDWLILLAVVLLALLVLSFIFLPKSEKKVCIITQNNVIMTTVDLEETKHQTLTLDGDYKNTVVIEDGRVCMAHSDCPNQLCVDTGWIHAPGQSIVCLPNRVVIEIVSDRAGEVDVVAG